MKAHVVYGDDLLLAFPDRGPIRPAHKIVIAGLDPAIHPLSRSFWVYVLASHPGGTLYVGVTNDLVRRVFGGAFR